MVHLFEGWNISNTGSLVKPLISFCRMISLSNLPTGWFAQDTLCSFRAGILAVLHNIALFCEPGWRLLGQRADRPGRRISAGQGCAVGGVFPIIDYCPEHGRLAQLVRAPRSHRGGRRFKSSIAHHVVRDSENRATARAPRAEVAEWQTRCVQGAVSLRMCGFKSLPRHQPANRANRTLRALVAQRIERCPAEAEVVSSNLAKRATCFPLFAPSDPH